MWEKLNDKMVATIYIKANKIMYGLLNSFSLIYAVTQKPPLLLTLIQMENLQPFDGIFISDPSSSSGGDEKEAEK